MLDQRKPIAFVIPLVGALAMVAPAMSSAADIPTSSPIVIDRSGSYRLQGNIIVQHQGNAIEILAPNVTLDLNGYSIIGNHSGIGIFSNVAEDITVVNGSVSAMGQAGIDLGGTMSCRIEKLHVTNSFGTGIISGHNCLLKDNTISWNGGPGIQFPPSDPFYPGPGMPGFGNNIINDNNGGNEYPQVEGSAIEIGTNVCGSTADCPSSAVGPALSPALW